jgi:DNA processing protein
MHPDEYVGWLALALTPGLGARTAGKLLREFGSPDAIFNASLTALEAQHLPAAVAQAIHSRRPISDAARELAQAQACGCRLLTWDEPEYPARLREIYDPPPLLYVKGNAELLNRHSISIVGARRPTPYGNQMAQRLAKDLADRGLVIVSGLARGIDACAHGGALSSASGATVGVLGCGIDVVYPKENKKIFEEMEKRGAIISEFPLGTFPGVAEFPDSEPDHCGNVAGCRGCGRGPILGIADYGAAGNGVWTGSLRYPGKRDATIEFRSESAH